LNGNGNFCELLIALYKNKFPFITKLKSPILSQSIDRKYEMIVLGIAGHLSTAELLECDVTGSDVIDDDIEDDDEEDEGITVADSTV